MKPLFLLLCFAVGSSACAQDLVLTITPPSSPLHVHSYLPFSARVTNAGKRAVLLTQPGDGSESGWRTPVVGWSILPVGDARLHPALPPRNTTPRCGNVNTIRRDEVFVLNPGGSTALEYVGVPRFEAAGRYRIKFYYQNTPDTAPGGLPFEPHDAEALALMKKSTPCLLKSNELIVTVLPDTEDSQKVSLTLPRLDEWVMHFRLYHEANPLPAVTMGVVLRAFFMRSVDGRPSSWTEPDLTNVVNHSLVDAWGTRFSHSYETVQGRAVLVTVTSAGPDRKFGTADDLSVTGELHPRKQ